jgi:glucans biosynthesis protein
VHAGKERGVAAVRFATFEFASVALMPLAFAVAWLTLCHAAASAADAFSFDVVAERARALAAKPYAAPTTTRNTRLLGLTYDQYRDVRFRESHATWRAERLPFELQYFHVGRGFTHPLEMHEVAAGVSRPMKVSNDAFTWGTAAFAAPTTPELAGFRVHYPMNKADRKDEVIVFLGASYFRALGAGHHYGLSARGVAVDTVGGSGEEFPAFVAYWVERPAADAKTLTVYALLDGPRVTGAYRFAITPGKSTVTEVKARLFLRAPVATLGIAPLTSMFLSGENQPMPSDFRPEVHDSDGLQVATADGEWIWRPLQNPKGIFTTSFSMRGLRGFGLMQRDRRFTSYEDTEARYDNRPSVWVEPVGDWGPGRVELMQFHTPDETNDNTVSYWVPERLPAPGQPLDFAWRMHWEGAVERAPGAYVVQSRKGRSYAELASNEQQYVIDFAGGALSSLADEDPVQAVVSVAGGARVQETNAFRHPVTGGWRATVRVARTDAAKPVELRAFLKLGSQVLSETWSYAIPPE